MRPCHRQCHAGMWARAESKLPPPQGDQLRVATLEATYLDAVESRWLAHFRDACGAAITRAHIPRVACQQRLYKGPWVGRYPSLQAWGLCRVRVRLSGLCSSALTEPLLRLHWPPGTRPERCPGVEFPPTAHRSCRCTCYPLQHRPKTAGPRHQRLSGAGSFVATLLGIR